MEPYELHRGPWKTLTLRVIPPDGRLRVSAPWYFPRFLVDRFVAEKASWVATRRLTLVAQDPAGGDTWPVWGTLCRVTVESPGRMPRVVLGPGPDEVVLRVPASWSADQRRRVLERWESERVKEALETLVPRWEARTGLTVDRWSVKRLRSRWGSCRPDTKSLVFNARLGAYPPECLEYVVVHELAHLVEAGHGPRFHALVDQWLPGARRARGRLRSAPGRPRSGEPAGPDASPGPPSTTGEGRGP